MYLCPMNNAQLSRIFDDIADRSEIRGENPFAVRAYRAAAETISGCERPLKDIYAEGGLDALMALNGIGKEIAKKIESLVSTGKLEFYDKLRADVPDGVAAMLNVQGLGPKRVKQIWETLGVDSLEKLEAAASEGKIAQLPKMGAKSEKAILDGIAALKKRATGRFLAGDVAPIADDILAMLKTIPGAEQLAYAGSLRRGKETIGDLDLLVATRDPAPVIRAFVSMPGVEAVLGNGETKGSVRLDNGLQVDLRAIQPEVWGTALQYFTGSQQHNIRLREMAQKQGWSLNEYALSRGEEKRAFADEAALYEFLGLPFIPPELREDRGEFENPIPKNLIALSDMRGDLQMHTTWSDGALDVMGMARAALALGYEYILITDHTHSLGVVKGLTPDDVLLQGEEIARANAILKKENAGLTVLYGVECEVLASGALDLPDEILARCDLVQASVHTSLGQARAQITARAIAAIENPHVDILGHPQGRLINERDGADYDWDALFRAAAQNKVALEINANPHRLDLNENNARRAVELGCLLSISTDAHTPEMLRNMRFGVSIARRAWVTREKVINTWPLKKLLGFFGR